MKISKLLCAFAISALSVTNVMAQQTYEEMEQLTVNEQVTTVITATEPIRFVDISTDKVVGDQPMNNTIRLKPKDSLYVDGEVLAIVTIVTERYRTQYALLYTTRLQEAVTDKEVQRQEMMPYNNPAVSMSTEEMTRFARQIWNSPARIRNVSTKQHRMVMRLNNIYSAGDYFFIDYSIENRTNIRFDIDQVRVKLSDKKLSKATNAQVIELNPVMTLEQAKSFKHGFRNVIVLKKMTFPNDKVLTIEMSEKQISGRNILLSIDYEDVLSADSVGCYGSEFDICLTKDNKWVVAHGPAVGGHKIAESTLEELTVLKLENGENVPSLEQFLKVAKKKTRLKLILELKVYDNPEWETKSIEYILATVKKLKLQRRMEYITFSWYSVQEFIRLAPKGTSVYYLNGDIPPEKLKEAGCTGPDYHIGVFRSHPDWIDKCHELGMKVNVWTVDQPHDMKWFIEKKADFITTDDPVVLQQLMK